MRAFYFLCISLSSFFSWAQENVLLHSEQPDSVRFFTNPWVNQVVDDAKQLDFDAFASPDGTFIFLHIQNKITDVSRQVYQIQILRDTVNLAVQFFDHTNVRYYNNNKTLVKSDSLFQRLLDALSKIDKGLYLQKRLSKKDEKRKQYNRGILFGVKKNKSWHFLLVGLNEVKFIDNNNNFPDTNAGMLFSALRELGIF